MGNQYTYLFLNDRLQSYLKVFLSGIFFCFFLPLSPTWLFAQQTEHTFQQPFEFTYQYEKRKGKKQTVKGYVEISVQCGSNPKFKFLKKPNQTIDFSSIPNKEIFVQIADLDLNTPDHFGKKKQYVLVFDSRRIRKELPDQISFKKSVAFAYAPDDKESKSRISFKVEKNGPCVIILPFGIVKKGAKPEDWTFNDGLFEIPMNIRGIEEKVIPPVKEVVDKEKELWTASNTSINKIIQDYLSQYPNGKYSREAIEKIQKLESADWEKVIAQKDLVLYQAYIDFWSQFPEYGIHLKNAQDKVNNTPEKPSEEQIDWNKTVRQNTITAYEDYIRAYPRGKYVKKAYKEIQALRPLELVLTELSSGKTEVRIRNAISPRYKDLSNDFGLQVDDSMLNSDSSTLIVRYPLRGQFKLLIEDKYGKRDSVSFDQTMSAIAHLNKSDSSLLTIKIQKGVPPFKVFVMDPTSKLIGYQRDSLLQRVVQIPIAELHQGDLENSVLIEVEDNSSWKPFQISNTVPIPLKRKSALPIPFILMLSLGAIVLILGIILLFRGLQKRRINRLKLQ